MGRICVERIGVGLCAVIVALTAMPLMAAVEEGTGNFELYFGSYQPDDPYDSDISFGIRGGGLLSERFGLQGTFGYFNSNTGCCLYTVDYGALFTDISAIWYVNPQNIAVFMVYGGSGLSYTSLETNTQDADELGITLHGGIGLNIVMGDRIYLRPDARLHWNSKSPVYGRTDGAEQVASDSATGYEISLAIGFTFGK